MEWIRAVWSRLLGDKRKAPAVALSMPNQSSVLNQAAIPKPRRPDRENSSELEASVLELLPQPAHSKVCISLHSSGRASVIVYIDSFERVQVDQLKQELMGLVSSVVDYRPWDGDQLSLIHRQPLSS